MTPCAKCRHRPATAGRSRCDRCREWAIARYAARKAAGVCPQDGCGRACEPGHSYCPDCGRYKLDALREYKARRAATGAR